MSIFVIDLDGTLLSESGELEAHVVSNLIQVQKMGHRIIVASGRTYSEANSIIKILELEKYRGAAVLADGQYVFDYCTGEEYVRERLMTEDIQRIIKEIGTFECPLKVFSKEGTSLIFPTKYCLKYLKYFIAGLLKRSRERLIDIGQLGSIIEADKIAADPSVNVENIRNYYEVAYINDKCRYEIKQKNVNKASSVRQILSKSRDDVFVFGNDENDICLFREFPNSYVMGNSTDTVKSYAKHIIPNREGETVSSEILRIVRLEGMKKNGY